MLVLRSIYHRVNAHYAAVRVNVQHRMAAQPTTKGDKHSPHLVRVVIFTTLLAPYAHRHLQSAGNLQPSRCCRTT